MVWKYTCPLKLTTALFIIAQIWKQSKCPSTEEWIKKIWYIYTVDEKIHHNLKVDLFYLVGMLRTPSLGDHFSGHEKTALKRQEKESGYIRVCNIGSRQSEHQRLL